MGRPPSPGHTGWLWAPKGKESKWPGATGGQGRLGARPTRLPGGPLKAARGEMRQQVFFFFFFLKGFSKIRFYLLSARAGAETQRPLPLGPNECGVPTIATEPTMPRLLLGVIPHRETAGWRRRGRPGRCRGVGAPSRRRQVTPATPKPPTARPPVEDNEPWGQGEGGSGVTLLERPPKATPPASWHSIFFLKERNAKAPTLLQLPKPPITHSKGALPHDCPPPEAPGGAGRKWTSWRAAQPGRNGGPPHLPGAASPPPPPGLSAAPEVSRQLEGQAAAAQGRRRGGRDRGQAFSRVLRGWACIGGLRARGPEEFSSPGLRGAAGKQGEQRADRLEVTDN